MQETHVIKEPFPGVFETLLDCPNDEIIYELISTEFKWILSWDYEFFPSTTETWEERSLPVKHDQENELIFTRAVCYDLLCETTKYVAIQPNLRHANIIQLNSFPPTFLDLNKIKGKQRFKILSELGWNFICELHSGDISSICSPNKNLVEHAIAWTEANDSDPQTSF